MGRAVIFEFLEVADATTLRWREKSTAVTLLVRKIQNEQFST
jgi:hypothetical protein